MSRRDTAHDPASLTSLLEALTGVSYEDAREDWNALMDLLRLELCYQPAVAIVLDEGRWRKSTRNTRGYVITAALRTACRKHGIVRLPEWRSPRTVARENGPRFLLRWPSGEDELLQDVDPSEGITLEEAIDNSTYRLASRLGVDPDESDFVEGFVSPRFLIPDDEATVMHRVDWEAIGEAIDLDPEESIMLLMRTIGVRRAAILRHHNDPKKRKRDQAALKRLDRKLSRVRNLMLPSINSDGPT